MKSSFQELNRRNSASASLDNKSFDNIQLLSNGKKRQKNKEEKGESVEKEKLVETDNNSDDSEYSNIYHASTRKRIQSFDLNQHESNQFCNGKLLSPDQVSQQICPSYLSTSSLHQNNVDQNQSTMSPDESIKSNISLSRRKSSIFHEIRVLSPRNSLSGVFYSSSIISRKNSVCNSNFRIDEIPATLFTSFKNDTILGVPFQTITESELLKHHQDAKPRKNKKFFIYFKWRDWMTQNEQNSLFIFSPDNSLRILCNKIADHPCFDYGILLFISLNCITLAMERPKVPPWSFEREFLNVANYVFTFVFAIEMAIKVIAKGLIYGENAYFKTGWNIMDGTLVAISLLDISLSLFAQKSPRIFGMLRVFRLLRSLRPLRYV